MQPALFELLWCFEALSALGRLDQQGSTCFSAWEPGSSGLQTQKGGLVQPELGREVPTKTDSRQDEGMPSCERGDGRARLESSAGPRSLQPGGQRGRLCRVSPNNHRRDP